ncbi:hypothetical protein, partial [Chitinilyticum piscinae]|uniref:hypothetical protein n=1 Tax=Chitinilyticum piscinae TaxID=2866724 RepID=UPI001D168677
PDAAKLAKLVVSLRLFRCVSSREAELYGPTLEASTPRPTILRTKSISRCFNAQQKQYTLESFRYTYSKYT